MNASEPFEGVYDAEVVAAIDALVLPAHDPDVRADWSAAVMFTTALMSGLAQAVGEEPEPIPVIEQEPLRPRDPTAAVEVILVPDAPAASVALVRPWLL
ncbi:MAG: hypothetical protein OEU32_04380 [Acidimicrobiia bacterium]|nr:hypothetical protein [Acidimicrobiia bacterium]